MLRLPGSPRASQPAPYPKPMKKPMFLSKKWYGQETIPDPKPMENH